MKKKNAQTNAQYIEAEIEWFQRVLDARFQAQSNGTEQPDILVVHPPPSLQHHDTPYAQIVLRANLDTAERLILIFAFLPHIRPDILDPFLVRNEALQSRFTEFGGVIGSAHQGFIPTCESALYLLAGKSIPERLYYLPLFKPDHALQRFHLLQLEQENRHEPPLSSVLRLTPETIESLTTGGPYTPPFNSEFPAQQMQTPCEWPDLVLDNTTRRDLEDIATWIRHKDELLDEWHLRKRLKQGFRSLFYGPPGTGKTLAATLLGKNNGMPVYRVDLSKVVSKYIGETEKNLASLFDRAERHDWILFFDEADSLFGKRTETHNSNDRSANQQVSYLLQRIEDFPGVVILASNLRAQIDEAFARRFQSIIYFPVPQFAERLRLWEDNFRNKPYKLAPDVDLPALARDHELSGGSIINILRYACLRAVVRPNQEIHAADILMAIRNERHKEGKFMSQS